MELRYGISSSQKVLWSRVKLWGIKEGARIHRLGLILV